MHPKFLLDTCAELLTQVLTHQHPADAVLSRHFKEQRQLGARERHLLSDAVFAVLREKPRLQWLLEQHPFPTSAPGKPTVAIRARAWALLTLPVDAAWRQAASSTDEQQWHQRCLARARGELPLACQHLLPEWLYQALQAQLGETAALALAQALQAPAPLDLRVNLLKTKRGALLQQLQQEGLEAQASAHSPWGIRLAGKPALQRHPSYLDGSFEIQDEGSQLLCLLPQVKRNEVVVDFCAGAGGKTLALGALMRNTGRLYAFDTSAHRLEALQPRLQRSGLGQVHPMALNNEQDERLHRLRGKVDRVLVDAPCSGLGTLRRSPDLKWRQTPASVAELAELQGRILDSAARLLKPGGRLVYATCSLLRQENEDVAQRFSQSHPDFLPLDAAGILQQQGVEAADTLCAAGYLRLWPHLHQTDGFFAAVWQRRG